MPSAIHLYHSCCPSQLSHCRHDITGHDRRPRHSLARSGGGEGATAREVLRHRGVERVIMVDIDEVVCRFCAQHLPKNTAAFKDPRWGVGGKGVS